MERRLARTRSNIPGDPTSTLLQTVEETTQRIYTLNAISAAISREENLDLVLEHALEWVLEVTGADAGTIFLLDDRTYELELRASKGLSEQLIAERTRLAYGQGLSGVVVQTGQPLVVEDVPGDPRTLPATIREGIRSFCGVPLRSDNRVVGVFNVLSRTPRTFTQADIELLLSIANQIGVAAKKSQLRSAETESREQLRGKMKQLSELLKVSATFRANAPLDDVLDAICSAVQSSLGFQLVTLHLIDQRTGLMTACAFSGFPDRERERLRQLSRPRQYYERIMQPKFRISDSYFISHQDDPATELGAPWEYLPPIDDSDRAEDEWHQQDALATPLHDRDGRLMGMLFVDDPKDRQLPTLEQVQVVELFAAQAALAIENAKLLEDLRKSEAKYRLLTETASDLIFLLAPDGTIAFLSASAEYMLGYQPEQLLGRMFSHLLTPDSRLTAPQYLLYPMAADELQGQCEVEMLGRDGGSVFMEINCAPVYENGRLSGEQGIARDISEKKRMEREIAQRQSQLRQFQRREEQLTGYAATVMAAQEEERKRIARDLHDDTAQALIALSRQIETLREYMRESPEAAERKLDDLQDLTDQTIASVRRFSRDLRPSVLDDLGLVPALEWLVAESHRRYGLSTSLKVNGEERRLAPEVELALFRITQEALNNVAKHADATDATVELWFDTDWCGLAVSDNGQGFSLSPQSEDSAGDGRMGLMGIHERANLLSGSVAVHTAPGEGTRITIHIPLSDR